jgi:hypothetical protein
MGEDLNYTELVRLLCCEFEIRTNSRKLADRLSSITQHSEQDLPVVQHSTLTLTWTGEEFCIRGDGIEDDFELSVNSTLEAVYNRLHDTAVAAMPDYIRIGAATGSNRGHAFLIIGPARAGKTTLALALMLDGIDMTGDALALLRGGKALAFPRKFHLRENDIGRISALKVLDRFADLIANPQESRLVALDPLDFGKPWRIAPAPVSAMFLLESNFGGRTTIRRSGKLEMVRRVLPHCTAPVSGRRDWLGDLCSTIDRAETFVVELGDLDPAVALLKGVLDETVSEIGPTPPG